MHKFSAFQAKEKACMQSVAHCLLQHIMITSIFPYHAKICKTIFFESRPMKIATKFLGLAFFALNKVQTSEEQNNLLPSTGNQIHLSIHPPVGFPTPDKTRHFTSGRFRTE